MLKCLKVHDPYLLFSTCWLPEGILVLVSVQYVGVCLEHACIRVPGSNPGEDPSIGNQSSWCM
jgi:hypothetical protein